MKNIIDYTELIKEYVDETVAISSGGYYITQQVTLSTSSDTTVTFSNSKITVESVLDVYTNKSGLNYSSITASAGSCTITFPNVSSAETITVRLYIK